MRGRKPKPLSVLKLTGAYRPHRHGKREEAPAPPAAALTCPPWLKGEARKCWNRLAPELAKMGLLSVLDSNLLGAYCFEWSLFVSAARKLADADACETTTPKGCPIQKPIVGIKNTSLANVTKLAAEFGCSPSARIRLRLPSGETGASPLDELIQEAMKHSPKRRA